jgi:hypothetical protein
LDVPLPGDRGEVLGRVVVEGQSPAARARGIALQSRAWAALVAVVLAAAVLSRRPRPLDRMRVATACGAILAVGILIACKVAPADTGDWLAYHTLLMTGHNLPDILILAKVFELDVEAV